MVITPAYMRRAAMPAAVGYDVADDRSCDEAGCRTHEGTATVVATPIIASVVTGISTVSTIVAAPMAATSEMMAPTKMPEGPDAIPPLDLDQSLIGRILTSQGGMLKRKRVTGRYRCRGRKRQDTGENTIHESVHNNLLGPFPQKVRIKAFVALTTGLHDGFRALVHLCVFRWPNVTDEKMKTLWRRAKRRLKGEFADEKVREQLRRGRREKGGRYSPHARICAA